MKQVDTDFFSVFVILKNKKCGGQVSFDRRILLPPLWGKSTLRLVVCPRSPRVLQEYLKPAVYSTSALADSTAPDGSENRTCVCTAPQHIDRVASASKLGLQSALDLRPSLLHHKPVLVSRCHTIVDLRYILKELIVHDYLFLSKK